MGANKSTWQPAPDADIRTTVLFSCKRGY